MSKRKLSKVLNTELDDAIDKSNEILQNQKEYKLQFNNNKYLTNYQSTVYFAQYECGTGVCINENGIIITCAHVLGDKPKKGINKIVIFSDGMICLTTSIKVSIKCDLALLEIKGRFHNNRIFDDSEYIYPISKVHSGALKMNSSLLCFGQPGRDDLESEVDCKTNYPIISVSKGKYIGCLEGDIFDNFEIGKLKHSCWTYWGHSGAPLFDSSGLIIGIHSSWDSDTCTRHGIHCEALISFIDE